MTLQSEQSGQLRILVKDRKRVRIEALHSIARNQAVIPGKALDAEFTVMQARVIAESTTGACEQAAISAEVAAMLNLIGHEKAARQAYQHSNQGLSRIEGQMELLTCLGHMVSSYTKSGNRGGALMLLQDMTVGIETLKSRDERDAVRQNVSRLYGKLNDMKMAQQLAAAITDPLIRNKTQYLNAIAELSTGRIGSAMTAIEAIQPPFFKARASAMLGLYQTRDETYNKLAEEAFNQARELTASLGSPSEKLVISSELARFAARAGKHAEADTGFSEAIQLLGQLPETNDRDQPLAILVTNQARALRFADARQQLTNIRDASLAQVTREKLADGEKLVQKIDE